MKLFLSLPLFFASLVAFTQEQDTVVLTLDDCINYAIENNIALQRAKNSELIARANRFQAIMNFFPTLTAGINYDFFFGNFFDQNAARQVSETTNSSQPNLSSSLTIFNGFSNQYFLKGRIQEQKSAEENVKNMTLNVTANILLFYLQVATNKERVNVSQGRVDLLETQLDRELKRIEVGVGSPEAAYQLKGQLSNEKLTLITDKNNLRRNLLTLVQEMQLGVDKVYDVSTLEVSDSDLLLKIDPFDQVLSESLSINPNLKRANADLEASRYSLKAFKAARTPTVAFFGRIGSNYSSNGARNPETGDFEENASFQDQLEFNQFEYVNFSLSIPIFSRYERTTDVQVAKVNYVNAELDKKQAVNNITNTVQQVYLDLIAGQQTYQSAVENMEAQESSFRFIKKRFDVGNTDFNAYLESLNNKNAAEIQLLSSKYEILLRKKILDLYRGV
ncbi:MAG: TolC family protein [Bacteroidota bacterium]